MPKLSVIIPVYNVSKFLPACIDSVLSSTFTDFELLLIDDGSSDNSGAICDKYATKDNRVKVIHKENGGVSSARNIGLDVASGQYITFIDSDDTITSEMFQVLMDSAIKYNCDISVCRLNVVLGNGAHKVVALEQSLLLDSKCVVSGFFSNPLIKELFYGPYNKIYSRKVIADIRFKTYAIGEDVLFVFDVLSQAMEQKSIYIDKYIGYNYFYRDNSAIHAPFSAKKLDYVHAAADIVETCRHSCPYVLEDASIWLYRHILVTLRQIYAYNLETEPEMAEFIKENKPLIKKNKKCLNKLGLKRMLDYYILTICPNLFKYIYR